MIEEFQKWCDETIGEITDKGMVKTSLADYQKMGIKITPQQYEKLELINSCMRSEEYEAIPAHFVLMLLKAFDLI